MATKTKKAPKLKPKKKFSPVILAIIILALVIPGSYLVYSSLAAPKISNKRADCWVNASLIKTCPEGSYCQPYISIKGKNGSAVKSLKIEWGEGSANANIKPSKTTKTYAKHTYNKVKKPTKRTVTITGNCPSVTDGKTYVTTTRSYVQGGNILQ